MSRVCGTWFDQKRVCRVPCPGLTKEGFAVSWFDQKVDQGLPCPVSDQGVPCLRNPCQQTRPGDKLSCRKPAGRATEQSLSVGVSSIQRHITQGSSHYGHQGLRISRNRGPDTDQKEEDMATSNRGCSKGNLRKVQLRSRSKKEINTSVNTRIGNLGKRLQITDNKCSCVFFARIA